MPRSRPPVIWVLTDERTGNVNQCLGVAERIGLPFVTKHLVYNSIAKLPTALWNTGLYGINRKISDSLTDQPGPQLVIAAGRKAAAVAAWLKKRDPLLFWLQLMWPGYIAQQADLVALPKHDRIRQLPQVIYTDGVPHRITPTKLYIASQQFGAIHPWALDRSRPIIALLVGGKHKEGDITPQHAKELARHVCRAQHELGHARLVVTTSRRTNANAEHVLRDYLQDVTYWYNPRSDDPNPYMAFLAVADLIIVTGDSMSMCSESVASGKTTYIYAASGMVSRKHQRFHEVLCKHDFAELVSPNTPFKIRDYVPILDPAGPILKELEKRIPDIMLHRNLNDILSIIPA
jgi:mitochondrial fission protein ELM1